MLNVPVLYVFPQKWSSLHLNGALKIVVQKSEFPIKGTLVCVNKNFCWKK